VDGGVGDGARHPLLLGGQQAPEPVRVALADQHDAGLADGAVDHVLAAVHGHRGGDRPAAADVLQHGGRRTGLALHLPEGSSLGAPPEDDRHREEGQDEAQDPRVDGVADREADGKENAEYDDAYTSDDKTDLGVDPTGHLVGQGDLLQPPGVLSAGSAV
jgi:hypothetical protein